MLNRTPQIAAALLLAVGASACQFRHAHGPPPLVCDPCSAGPGMICEEDGLVMADVAKAPFLEGPPPPVIVGGQPVDMMPLEQAIQTFPGPAPPPPGALPLPPLPTAPPPGAMVPALPPQVPTPPPGPAAQPTPQWKGTGPPGPTVDRRQKPTTGPQLNPTPPTTDVATPGTLHLEVAPSKDVVSVGERFEFTVSLRNEGGSAVSNVELQATVSDNLKIIEARPEGAATIQGTMATFSPIQSFAPMQLQYQIAVEAVSPNGGRGRVSVEAKAPALASGPLRREAIARIAGP